MKEINTLDGRLVLSQTEIGGTKLPQMVIDKIGVLDRLLVGTVGEWVSVNDCVGQLFGIGVFGGELMVWRDRGFVNTASHI